MRVGLRRLRAAIALFSRLLPDGQAEKIKAELKWLTDELAPSREIDVFVKEKIRPLSDDLAPRRGGKALEDEFVAKRNSALDRAKRAVTSERFRALLLDVLEWIEGIQNSSDDTRTAIGEFATDVLHRRLRKIFKQGRRLAKFSARERHKLRIRVKKSQICLRIF
jgi:CHAD domain-containing protein